MGKNTAITALRIICCLAMAIGLIGALYGFFYKMEISLFAFDVPSWIIGISAAYLGLRHYRRIPELESKIEPGARFSWARLSPFKSR